MSEEARPMTPTEEEAELARVMCGNKPREWQDKLVHDHDPMAPLETDGDRPMKPRWMRFAGLARLILAAGYVKRNDALEEAAKAVERIARERGWSGAKALGKLGIASATIRALKAKT